MAKDTKQQVEIEFTFPTKELGGSEVVIFEELYDVNEPEKKEPVAEHKDINSKYQTVSIEEKPQEEEKEEVKTAPKTGDRSAWTLFVFILLLVLSCTAIFRCVTIMRKTK